MMEHLVGRMISDAFADSLRTGILAPLAERVRNDDTLMLALRDTSVNIYYRGGSILRLIEGTNSGRYVARFDDNYVKPGSPGRPELPDSIGSAADCQQWLQALPALKEIMNYYLAKHASKSEREFQQLVAWENNRSKLANETDYFITDIEFATNVPISDEKIKQARLDMVGLRWLTSERKKSLCSPVFIEMKYGTAAYGGTSGIAAHIKDLNEILNEKNQDSLRQMIAGQFNQLAQMKMIHFNPHAGFKNVEVVGKPEVVFLLANNNPRSGALLKILNEIVEPTSYDLRFFVASFAGYAMHDKCMMSLDQFKTWVGR